MSWPMFEQIIDKLRGHHVSLGLHFAGESLLHPQFKQFICYVMIHHNEFNNVGFFTNGMLFNHDIADFIIASGIDWVTFSLEGYTEVNDATRVGSEYMVVAENIEYLLSQRPKKVPFVSINATMQPDHDESSWNRFVKEWTEKVDRVSLNPCIDDNFHWITFWKNVKLKKRRYCTGPSTGLNILSNGDIVLCGCDLNGKTKAGNIHDTSIFEFWNSARAKRIRDDLSAGLPIGYPCDYCERWKYVVDEKPTIVDGIKVSYDLFVKNYEKQVQ